jgi:hypothetical protein
MYEKKIETFDELLNSDIVFGYSSALNYGKGSLEYPEIDRFLEHKKLKVKCRDVRECVERMLTKRDISLIVTSVYINHVAREMGTDGIGKVICCFDESLGTVGTTVIFKKGNPLLELFNFLMRRYLEAGFQEMVWSEAHHRASLRGRGRFREAAGDRFFAFSISHLMPAFGVLFVGTVLSSVVFIGELIVNCLCKRRGKISFLLE